MKTLIFVLTIGLLTITSCQTANFGNFNKRKFTNLKPLQNNNAQEKENEEQSSLTFDEPKIADRTDFKADLDRITENDPKIKSIQKAINDGEKIILKSGGDYYEVKKPFYDGISRSLIGRLVKIDEPVEEDHLEIGSNDYRTNPNGLSEISMNDITFYQSKQGVKQNIEEPVEKDNPEKIETEKTPVKQAPTQAKVVNQQENDRHTKLARETFFTGLGFVGVMLVSVILAVTLNIFGLIFLLGAAFLLAYILMCCSMFHGKRIKHKSRKAKYINNAARVFFILGTIVCGIALLVGVGALFLVLIF